MEKFWVKNLYFLLALPLKILWSLIVILFRGSAGQVWKSVQIEVKSLTV